MFDLPVTDGDAPAFVQKVERIAGGLVQSLAPDEVYFVRVDGRFDHKWLFFAGSPGFSVPFFMLPARIPPFDPNRVTAQRQYRRGPGGYEYAGAGDPLHIHQESRANLRRRVDQRWSSVSLFWYSGGTDRTGCGTLMCCARVPAGESGWLASLHVAEDGEWRVGKCKRISREALLFYEHATAVPDYRRMG
jgi:hypothetical protein